MHCLVPRILVIVCGSVLALPQGWCCMGPSFALPRPPQTHEPSPSTCCECCKTSAKPKSSKTSAPRPAPVPSDTCPCADRNSTAPVAPEVVGCDLSLPAPLPVIDLVPTWLSGDVANSLVLPSDVSFQLLHCIWLC
jgi:hypothetical protein